MKIPSKYQLDKVASADTSRTAINVVRIEKNRAIATDGRCLVIVAIARDDDGDPISIRREFFEAARKEGQESGSGHTEITIENNDAFCEISGVGKLSGGSEKEYPNFANILGVIPEDALTRKVTFRFNAELLGKVCAALGTTQIALCCDPTDDCGVTVIRPCDPTQGIAVLDPVGFLMPLKNGGDPGFIPKALIAD